MQVYYKPYTEPSQPNNIITYTASAKLAITTGQNSNGLHTNAFNTTIKSHTFENGTGTIEFNGDVTSFGNYAFYDCSRLTSITIPNSVTSIGTYAFYYCDNLTSVIMGNGVTSIGERAFQNCYGLTSITIPNIVTSIHDWAFDWCNALTTLTITDYATYTLNKNTNINGSRGCYITLANGTNQFISLYFMACCFVASTQVTMGDLTTKNIENIQVGDRVLSYDLGNDTNIVTTVKRTIVHENTTDIATITLENGYTATMNEYHPILCSDGWHSITNYNGYPTLAEGNMVKTQDGYSRLVSLQRTVVEPFITYNLDVVDEQGDNDNDNFYANGICAHNVC